MKFPRLKSFPIEIDSSNLLQHMQNVRAVLEKNQSIDDSVGHSLQW
jgi:hypothetical protein